VFLFIVLMNRILRSSLSHRSLMTVSIRGHRADSRDFPDKFNGIHSQARPATAPE